MKDKKMETDNKFKIRLYRICTFSILFFFGTRLNTYAEVIDKVVAKVNNEIITLSEMRERAYAISMEKRMAQNAPALPNDTNDKDLLDSMINNILKLQFAKKRGMKVPDEYVYSKVENIKTKNSLSDEQFRALLLQENLTMNDYIEKIRESLMISNVDSLFSAGVILEEKTLQEYYKQHIPDFLEPEAVKIRHILLLTSKEAKKHEINRVRRKAEDIFERIKKGADFSELARLYSEGANAPNGGEIGFFQKGAMMPEIEKVAFSMQKNTVSDIIQTKHGFHIVKLIEKREAKPKNFDQVRKFIEGKLFFEKATTKLRERLNELREKAYIEVLMTFK